jgi:F-type H+-transporting ATPase subunit a
VLAAFVFPPIDEIFRWRDVAFKGTPFALNKTGILCLVSAALVVWLFIQGSRKMKLVPHGLQNVVEMGYEFIDRGIAKDVIGPTASGWTPFLGALFFYILFMNIWEIIPGVQFPPTSRFAIPFYLAMQTYVIMIFVGFKTQGFKYVTHHIFPPGVPLPLYLLVTPIEIVSVFIVRPFSLAVRLLANMMAGHILLTAMALLTAYALKNAPLIAIGPFALNIAVTAFEILVAFLQAYIFTLLTAVYIAESVNPEH